MTLKEIIRKQEEITCTKDTRTHDGVYLTQKIKFQTSNG